MKYEPILIPKELKYAVEQGIIRGKQIRRKKRRTMITGICSSIAAACALFITVCVSNPTMASKIPFVGKIFEKIEDDMDFAGDYSEYATHLADSLSDAVSVEEESTVTDTYQKLEELYGDTNQNITVIPEEVYCDGISLYLGLRMINMEEDGFGIVSDDYRIELRGTVESGAESQEFVTMLIGSPENLNTFMGMIKLPAHGVTESVDELKINIETIFWSHEINREKKYENPDLQISYHILKDGGWELTIPVAVDNSRSKTYEIHDINEMGYGIDTVYITPYEIQVKPITPYDEMNENGYMGCFAVFNENGEYFSHGDWSETEALIVDGKSTEHLYFYFFEDEFEAVKCWDQGEAESNHIYKYELIAQ